MKVLPRRPRAEEPPRVQRARVERGAPLAPAEHHHVGAERDELGARACVALQALRRIREPLERARRNWQAMSTADQANTFAAYRLLIGGCPCEQDPGGSS